MLLSSTCVLCRRAGPCICSNCLVSLPVPPAGAPAPALTAYEGAGRDLLTALKFRGARSVAVPLGRAMAALVSGAVDVVTWAPTSRRRRHDRGFDQARLLARALARELGVPCRGLLRRRPGPPQTGRGRAERLGGPTFNAWRRPPARVLLVDDVVTTGSTLASARAALLAAGAVHVHAVAAAATPGFLAVRHAVGAGSRASMSTAGGPDRSGRTGPWAPSALRPTLRVGQPKGALWTSP